MGNNLVKEGKYMSNVTGQSSYPLDPLVQIMKELRGPEGCPWDKEQTHESLKRYLIEETYEVIEAIELADMNKLREELGDLLLQIVFHAELASEKSAFDMNDVVEAIAHKMRTRHPHVFGHEKVDSAAQVLVNWENIKDKEKAEAGERKTLMDVPRGLPALLRAEKIQARASRVGFDWPDVQGAWEKVKEEQAELLEALESGQAEKIEDEFGDLLFALVNVARFLRVDPEEALTKTIDKFIHRFQGMEEIATRRGLDLHQLNLEQLDNLWEEVKSKKNKW